MPVVLLRPRAQDDITEIWGYIADDSELHADAFVDRLDAKFQLLAQKPGLGRMRDELAPGVRSFPVGRYVIYRLLRGQKKWKDDRLLLDT